MGVRMIRVDDRSGKVIEGERGDGRAENERDLHMVIPWCPALTGVGFDDLSTEERMSIVGHLAALFKMDRLDVLKGAVGYDGQPLLDEDDETATARRRRASPARQAAPAPLRAVAPPPPAAPPRADVTIVPQADVSAPAEAASEVVALAFVSPDCTSLSGYPVGTTLSDIIAAPTVQDAVAALEADVVEHEPVPEPERAAAPDVVEHVPGAPVEPTVPAGDDVIDGDAVTHRTADGIAQTSAGWFWIDVDGVPVGPFASCPMARMNKMDVAAAES